jgi:hypothetical protein
VLTVTPSESPFEKLSDQGVCTIAVYRVYATNYETCLLCTPLKLQRLYLCPCSDIQSHQDPKGKERKSKTQCTTNTIRFPQFCLPWPCLAFPCTVVMIVVECYAVQPSNSCRGISSTSLAQANPLSLSPSRVLTAGKPLLKGKSSAGSSCSSDIPTTFGSKRAA